MSGAAGEFVKSRPGILGGRETLRSHFVETIKQRHATAAAAAAWRMMLAAVLCCDGHSCGRGKLI